MEIITANVFTCSKYHNFHSKRDQEHSVFVAIEQYDQLYNAPYYQLSAQVIIQITTKGYQYLEFGQPFPCDIKGIETNEHHLRSFEKS